MREVCGLDERESANLPKQEPFSSILDPAKTVDIQTRDTRNLFKKIMIHLILQTRNYFTARLIFLEIFLIIIYVCGQTYLKFANFLIIIQIDIIHASISQV